MQPYIYHTLLKTNNCESTITTTKNNSKHTRIKSTEPQKKPRSSARDLQGFSQRKIWNYIKAENLKLSDYKLAFIIKNAASMKKGDQLIH